MLRFAMIGLCLSALLASGCTTAPVCHDGKFIAAYNPGGKLDFQQAPYKATYILHYPPPILADGTPSHFNAHWTVRELSEGDYVGFGRGENGELIAIAGSDRIPLVDGAYCWHVTEQTELRGGELALHETGKALVATGRFTGRMVIGVLLWPIVTLWQIPVCPFSML